VLALLAILLLKTGLDMSGASDQLGLGACLAHATATGDRGACGDLALMFQGQFGFVYGLSFWLSVLPALLGRLVGAPLVAREVEQHTHLLAWTQSITRSRWVTVKLALVLTAGLLASGVLMGLLIW
jgi:ABC-type transport system involved in multi-copper enzyme maturation permease subunit